MGRRKKQGESSGGASWLTTYSDLVTLLLCFFVLLFSMAVVDKQKVTKAALSIRAAFLGQGRMEVNEGDTLLSLTPNIDEKDLLDRLDEEAGKEGEEDDDTGNEGEEGDKTVNEGEEGDETGEAGETDEYSEAIGTLRADIQGLIDRMGLNEHIKVVDEGAKIILRMDSVILFDTGKADLIPSARPVIEKIGEILKTLDTEIQVQGHADDRPINTPEFPSNWELSTRRATNVVKFLVEKCDIDPKYLTATGNAEFRPIAPNDTEYNRQKNRRIDIAIYK
jgi:chemotaxis protein MotB